MISKTRFGVDFFDAEFAGLYRGRSALVCGRTGTGKTILSIQFVHQGLRLDERCLMLSTLPASDLAICAEGVGLSLATAIDAGDLILLEYENLISGRGVDAMLPPEGFDQLREQIEANAIKRVVLDTVLPWVITPDTSRVQERVFSFVRALDRLGPTSLLTLPKPVSPAALRMRHAFEDALPVSILLAPTETPNRFRWQVSKYLGEKHPQQLWNYEIETGKGVRLAADSANVSDTPDAGRPVPQPTAAPAASRRHVRFAQAFPVKSTPPPDFKTAPLASESPNPPETASRKGTEPDPESPVPAARPELPPSGKKARFATLWPELGQKDEPPE